MTLLFAGLLGVVGAEVFLRLPFKATVRTAVDTMRTSMWVIGSPRISDHWKERVVLRYSCRIFGRTWLLALLFVVLAAAAAAVILAAWLAGVRDPQAFTRPLPIAVTLAASILYHLLRTLGRGSDYPLSARLLHHLALGLRPVAEASFDIEQAGRSRWPPLDTEAQHVFVAGLARAGTTVLMRRFFACGAFESLTYRDMPFVLMPNTWRRITASSRKQSSLSERAHGDGLLVDYDSPEALEEVFWRVFAAEEYIRKDRLVPMPADDALVERFRSYVASILARSPSDSPRRYLSKNNYNILRLASIRQAFPRALIVIPFRDPLQQACSLLRQHRRFVDAQRGDRFILRYMTWLGHFDFGLGHRPFAFSTDAPRYSDPLSLNHWLEQWVEVYGTLAPVAEEVNAILLSYESLCSQTDRTWTYLRERASLPEPLDGAEDIRGVTREVNEDYDAGLHAESVSLYGALRDREHAIADGY